jgi:hypothetical protein
MAAGCVPLVFARGGQAEVVEHGRTGFHWSSLEELKTLTLRLVHDRLLERGMAAQAQERAAGFERRNFVQGMLEVIRTDCGLAL